MTFPDIEALKRTYGSFRDQEDPLHHVGDSPFTLLKNDILSLFPLDYGDLQDRPKREPHQETKDMCQGILRNFTRKPRGVDEVDW